MGQWLKRNLMQFGLEAFNVSSLDTGDDHPTEMKTQSAVLSPDDMLFDLSLVDSSIPNNHILSSASLITYPKNKKKVYFYPPLH
jgi:hypothetical protein